jgi:hypothetical protein
MFPSLPKKIKKKKKKKKQENHLNQKKPKIYIKKLKKHIQKK